MLSDDDLKAEYHGGLTPFELAEETGESVRRIEARLISQNITLRTSCADKPLLGHRREKIAYKLRAKYEQGATIRELATAHGRSYGAVHRLLSVAGATLRPPGGMIGRTRQRKVRA